MQLHTSTLASALLLSAAIPAQESTETMASRSDVFTT